MNTLPSRPRPPSRAKARRSLLTITAENASVIVSKLKSQDSASSIFVRLNHLELEDVIFLTA